MQVDEAQRDEMMFAGHEPVTHAPETIAAKTSAGHVRYRAVPQSVHDLRRVRRGTLEALSALEWVRADRRRGHADAVGVPDFGAAHLQSCVQVRVRLQS